MKNHLLIGVLAGTLAHAASGKGQVVAAGAAATAAVAPHLVAAAPAIVTGTVSAASAHVGQAVLAKLTSASSLSNGTKLPVGSQLLGKVTQAVPLGKGGGKSSLGMVFDRVRTSDGKEMPLSGGTLQAVGNAGNQQTATGPSSAEPANANGNASGGGLLGGVVNGVGSTVGGVVNGVGSTVNGLVGTVTSLPGVLLDSTGTLVAQGKNVNVPAGTQITVAASAGASAGH